MAEAGHGGRAWTHTDLEGWREREGERNKQSQTDRQTQIEGVRRRERE